MQNTNETMQKAPSLTRAIVGKVATHIQETKVSNLLKQLMEGICGLFLGVAIVKPDKVSEALIWAAKIEGYAIPKLLLFSFLYFGRKSIVRAFNRMIRSIEIRRAEANEEKMIDDIPVPELVDYMLRNKHFKREGVNGVRATFGLNMEKFNALAKKLEENKVLVRGENNGRILADSWSRQALIDYLSGEERSEDLQPRFTIHRIGANAKVRLMREELAV